MSEERRRILDMLAEGKLTADEAEKLLAALGATGPALAEPVDAAPTPRRRTPRYLRVVVGQGADGEGERVNIRVPLDLIRAGIKLQALIPSHAREKVNGILRDRGIDLDLASLVQKTGEELIAHLADLSVEVNEDNERVRIFCE
ncbi:hypothetical protein HQ576_20430 [bacterium]|nr:hypothetical protein [bacterium]